VADKLQQSSKPGKRLSNDAVPKHNTKTTSDERSASKADAKKGNGSDVLTICSLFDACRSTNCVSLDLSVLRHQSSHVWRIA